MIAYTTLRLLLKVGYPVFASHLLSLCGCSVEKIKAAIAPGVQDKKYADYRKTLPPKPPAEGLIRWVKKNAWEKD